MCVRACVRVDVRVRDESLETFLFLFFPFRESVRNSTPGEFVQEQSARNKVLSDLSHSLSFAPAYLMKKKKSSYGIGESVNHKAGTRSSTFSLSRLCCDTCPVLFPLQFYFWRQVQGEIFLYNFIFDGRCTGK